MSSYIFNLIKQGEHQQLDFKFEISDSRKIARTLAAFANTDGGKLLIGVKDNGKIAGVRSDEEYYMLEGASSMYCKPEVKFRVISWKIEGKTVLEVDVEKNENEKHYCQDESGKWLIYVRVADQNILASTMLLRFWKMQKQEKPIFIKYSRSEKILIDYLHENKEISISKFCKIAQITNKTAEDVILNLMVLQMIDIKFDETKTVYFLANR
ncbi:MAG TPA: ATP-binding protein [Bacteroidales bacterium]|nr:MAG: hypothetical protein A2W98_09625 [Bacteroidetes bacterium GWF2_33_38]OFY74775.1 MAG: hypothetical protein A2265_07625 [Bacteroidetes bacterium RIFOXYA12_FULL_33_9]HBF87094.1 ATP-binding protein [Bacteroidales bacterium]